MTDSTSKTETLWDALHQLQQNLPHVGKDNTADTGKYKYKYADLNDVQDALFPLFERFDLTWTAAPTMEGDYFVLRYSLSHVMGESVDGFYLLPKGTPQEIGSALTYARRYALCAVTGLAPGGDDDDGAKASIPPKESAKPAAAHSESAQWVGVFERASDIETLQGAWEQAGKAGATGDPAVIAAKNKRKKELQDA